MNHSLRSADRETHVRIVAISLIAGIAVVVAALNARLDPRIEGSRVTVERSVIKASRLAVYSGKEQLVR